jgi:hypothetical protein
VSLWSSGQISVIFLRSKRTRKLPASQCSCTRFPFNKAAAIYFFPSLGFSRDQHRCRDTTVAVAFFSTTPLYVLDLKTPTAQQLLKRPHLSRAKGCTSAMNSDLCLVVVKIRPPKQHRKGVASDWPENWWFGVPVQS